MCDMPSLPPLRQPRPMPGNSLSQPQSWKPNLQAYPKPASAKPRSNKAPGRG